MIAVAAAVFLSHRVEERVGPVQRIQGDVEPGHSCTLQGHENPARHREIAGLMRDVSPSPFRRLGFHAIFNCLHGGFPVGLLERRIACHRIQFADGDRRDPLGIEAVNSMALTIEAPFVILFPQEIVPAPFDDVLVFAVFGCIAVALEGQQGHGGGDFAILRTGSVGVGAHKAPRAVFLLVPCKPLEACQDGLLGQGRATVGTQQRLLRAGLSSFVRNADHSQHGVTREIEAGHIGQKIGRLRDRLEDLQKIVGGENWFFGSVHQGRGKVRLDHELFAKGVGERSLKFNAAFKQLWHEEERQHDQGDHVHDGTDQPGWSPF